jgi:hypothetical protein
MDRQNLIERLVARKLQPAAKVKAFCVCVARVNGKPIYFAQARPKQ